LDDWISGNERPPLYGAAIVKAGVVRAVRLDVLSDEPPLRHAVIKDWPWIGNDPEAIKAEQKRLAALLASAAGPPVLR
jgi:hypothetical protein